MNGFLIDRLSAGECLSTAELADSYGITIELMEAMLFHYECLGYLRRTVLSSHRCEKKSCAGCTCGKQSAEPVVFWEVVNRNV